jgi:hypothetical protein
MASWGRSVLNGGTTAGWTFAASAALGLTHYDQLLLALLVGTATFAMYAQDYLSGALDGADDGAKQARAAFLRAHASMMRASIRAAMVVCTAAMLALRPGTQSLSVVAAGMLLGFAYNANWLPGEREKPHQSGNLVTSDNRKAYACSPHLQLALPSLMARWLLV